MSSNCPPNVPSPPNSDGDKVAHSSAISRNLFDTFGEQKKGKRGETTAGVRGARVERKGDCSEEETDLCNNVLAAQRQCPHVRKAGLHFMDRSSRIMHRNCGMVRVLEPTLRPFHLEAQAHTDTSINLSGILQNMKRGY